MSESLDRFIGLLLQAELITPSQLVALRQQLSSEGQPTTVDAGLAQRLADSGHLTDFQADEVRKGKIENLVVGDYLILHPVGKGGMGQVFKARHSVMKREVAVKFLLPDREGKIDQSSAARFQREVEAASKLSHPNVVSSLDAGRRGEVCYLVMEYVRGMNLASYIRENGPMSYRQALNCIIQAAQGLEYAHGKGIIHRDIKPGNLLITKDGQVKVLDMGLVRLTGYEDQSPLDTEDPLTHSGHLLGTVDFMAPEQAMDPHAADARADIYSLGCTLYYLLTGRTPYPREGRSATGRIIAHREFPIPSLCKARTDVPASFEPIFHKMMAKLAQKRYQSVMELLADLRRAQVAVQASTDSPTETQTFQQPPVGRLASRLGWTFATAVLVLLAMVGIYRATRPEITQEPLVAAGSVAAGSVASQPPPILTNSSDLLPQIDLTQHIVAGSGWQLSDGKLFVPPSVPSKLNVPVALPAAFRLKATVTRTGGNGPFVLGLNQDGRKFYLLMDAYRKANESRLTTLGTKDGRLVIALNDVLHLEPHAAIDLLLAVDHDSISLRAGEDEVLRWQGNLQILSLGAGWGVSGAPGILLGSNDQGSFEVTHLEVLPAGDAAAH